MTVDLDAIKSKWLYECGACDYGVGYPCTHPSEDYRPVMLNLVREVERLREDEALVAQAFEEYRASWNRSRDALEAEVARLRDHILDIDAHATPYGDLPDEPGFVGVYLLTAGALHRALGRIGHSAPSCQAEAERDAALAEVERLRLGADAVTAEQLSDALQERDEARAELERLRRVGMCGIALPGTFGSSPPMVCDLPAGHDGWHGADNVSPPSDPYSLSTRCSWSFDEQGFIGAIETTPTSPVPAPLTSPGRTLPEDGT